MTATGLVDIISRTASSRAARPRPRGVGLYVSREYKRGRAVLVFTRGRRRRRRRRLVRTRYYNDYVILRHHITRHASTARLTRRGRLREVRGTFYRNLFPMRTESKQARCMLYIIL